MNNRSLGLTILFILILLNFACLSSSPTYREKESKNISGKQIPRESTNAIRPFKENPYYWQYHGDPVMLLGGSKDDNLFQTSNLEEHLDLMKEVGANYIRNTMSGRDTGNVKAFKRLSTGKFDLNKWNSKYWNRFSNLLKLTSKRGIFVQIELWDQWDHNEDRWNSDPWNPDVNINYSTSDTRLKGNNHYKNALFNTNKQHDLFLTVPKLHNDIVVLHYQKRFIDKILSYTLQYDHILYTITNELFNQHPVRWSLFWIEYIKDKAEEAGKTIQTTEMFQEPDITSGKHLIALNNPYKFDYFEASQNASKSNQEHWYKLQWIREYLSDNPRPINHTKTYGSDEIDWTGGTKQAIERFWRSIIGGAASVRFHRPPAGIGLSSKAQTQIRSARMLLSEFDIFQAKPDIDSSKLYNRDPDEAYLSCISGKQYVIYFPQGGDIKLDLRNEEGNYKLKWLKLNSSTWRPPTSVNGGKKITLKTPSTKSWIAFLISLK